MRRNEFIICCGIVFYLFVTLNYPYFSDLLIEQAKAAGNFTLDSQRGLKSEDLFLTHTIKTHHWKVTTKVSSSQPTPSPQNLSSKREVTISSQKAKLQDEGFVITHLVKPGDTLSEISLKYGVKISTLSKLNGLKGDILPVGMKLKIMSQKRDSNQKENISATSS